MSNPSPKGLWDTVEKLLYLYEQVKAHGLNLVGVQEGRNEEVFSTSHDMLRIGAGHCGGHYGVELWVNLKQPIGIDKKKQPRYLKAQHFQVCHKDPQRLVVKCQAELLTCWILVAHAPHSGHTRAVRQQWWEQTDCVIDTFGDGLPWIWLIDANAEAGDADDITVFARDLASSANTDLFKACLLRNGLCLPSTMACHEGPRSTWTSPDGTTNHCIDYVAIPYAWKAYCTYSCVIDTLDLCTTNEDHKAVGVQLVWTAEDLVRPVTKRCPQPNWHCKQARHSVLKKINLINNCSWQTDVETQAHHLSTGLQSAMRHSPQAQRIAKKPYITEQLWQWRAQKLRLRLKEVQKTMRQQALRDVLYAWQHKAADTAREDRAPLMVSLFCSKLKLLAAYRNCSKRLQKGLRNAKHEHLRESLDALDTSTPASGILRCLRSYIGPTNPKMCKKKTIPLVHNEEGQPCKTPQEALDTWVDFFKGMEGGERVSREVLRQRWRRNLSDQRQSEVRISCTELPTLTDLEIALRSTSCGKTSGADDIPGELLHHFPAAIDTQIYPALWKLLLHGQEDLSYKGGVLVQAYKGRGAKHHCASFRSLLISSQIGKAIHRTIRTCQADIFEKLLQKQQVGGKRRMPVAYGLHQVRAHLRQAHRHGICAAIVFVDLTEAFYRIFRPLCMNNVISDEALAAFLHKLKMPESALHELWQLLDGPNALQAAELPPHLQRSIAAIHCNTHFWMKEQDDVVETQFGSRPGDPFADVCFSYVWARVLLRLQDYMEQHGLADHYPVMPQLNLFGTLGASDDAGEQATFIGPTWMDDTAICLSSPSAAALISKATQTAGRLLELCVEHGMTPNLKRGKSEILLSLRGPKSRRHKIALFGPTATLTLPILTEHTAYDIPITNKYLHLGGLLHHGPDQRTEVKRRLALAHAAFNQHRKVLYHNQQIPLAKRSELFQVLIVTKLLYGSESWLITDDRTVRTFHAAIIKLYRRLLKLPGDQHWCTDKILATIGLPSPDTLLRRQRLRYLGTLYRCGTPQDWGFFSADVEWCAYIENDLEWMWMQLQRSSSLPDPKTDFAHWHRIIKQYPKYWKRLIRRAAEHEIMQLQRLWKVREFHLLALDRLQVLFQPGQEWKNPDKETENKERYGCLQCQLSCASKAGEAAHMFKQHGHAASIRRYFEEPTCPACLRVFHTMQKTKAHIHYSVRCRRILQSRRPVSTIAPGAGSALDRMLTDQHDRLLPPLQAEGPQNQVPRLRDDPKINHDFFVFLTDLVGPSMCLVNFEQAARTFATDYPISWTLWLSTLRFFENAFTEEDAQFAHKSVEEMRETIERLCNSEAFPFLEVSNQKEKKVERLEVLEKKCQLFMTAELLDPSPVSFGRHRVLLHAYSGRRRPGDLQFFLEKFHEAQDRESYVLHIVSMDIVIDAKYGDARNEGTRDYWLGAIRDRKVVAFVAGPPCETWTAAREHQLDNGNQGPRPVRSADELWGFFSMQLRELCQVCVGNELLIFALQAFIELIITGGCGLLEHPAPPPKPTSPSIWKLQIVKVLQEHPDVETCRFAQGLLGAPTPKPTQLLLLNMPCMIFALHQWRVCRELPRSSAIGLDENGSWRTSPLKEYPPAMCGAVAEVLTQRIRSIPVCSTQEPPQSDLKLWASLCVTHYGQHFGSDFAVKR